MEWGWLIIIQWFPNESNRMHPHESALNTCNINKNTLKHYMAQQFRLNPLHVFWLNTFDMALLIQVIETNFSDRSVQIDVTFVGNSHSWSHIKPCQMVNQATAPNFPYCKSAFHEKSYKTKFMLWSCSGMNWFELLLSRLKQKQAICHHIPENAAGKKIIMLQNN